MRRSAMLILASLVLGTITALLLAWPCAIAAAAVAARNRVPADPVLPPPDDRWWAEDDADGRRGWPVPRAGHYLHHRSAFLERVDFRRIIFMGAVRELPYYQQNPPPPWAATLSTDMREGFEQVITSASGWPIRCFRAEHWISWRDGPPAERIVTIEGMPGIKLPALPTDPPTPPPQRIEGGRIIGLDMLGAAGSSVVLPLRPMWARLLANVLLFSTTWAMILLAPRALGRSLRRRRGQCPACAYDLRGTPAGSPCPECGNNSVNRAPLLPRTAPGGHDSA